MSRFPPLRPIPGHPRLWLTAHDLPDFRQAARSYRRPWRDSLLAHLEPAIASPATVRAQLNDYTDYFALALGQAWQLTGDRRYPQAARWLLEGLWTYPTQTRHDYDVWGVTAETAALLYDWCHDYWQSQGELRAVAELTAFCTHQALDHFLRMYIVDDWHNYALGLQAGALAGALALAGEFPDLGVAKLLRTLHQIHFTGYRYAATRFQDLDTIEPTRLCLQAHLSSRGGVGFCAHQEATGGYHSVDSFEFLKMAIYWTGALRRRPTEPPVWPELDRMGLAHLHFLRPDRKNLVWGDSSPVPTHRTRLGVMLMLLNRRRAPAAPPQPAFDAYIQACLRPDHFTRAVHALLAAPPLPSAAAAPRGPAPQRPLAAADFAALPTAAWLDPLAVMRSDWSSSATMVTFRVGRHGGGHNHFDHNGFTLFRGGPLALDSGWVDYTARSRVEYSIRTLAHNCILVRDRREKFWHGRHAAPTQNDGGQRLTTNSYNPPNSTTGTPHAVLTEERRRRLHDEFDMGTLLAHHFEPAFDYVAGDATRAYTYPWSGLGTNSARRVEECVRQLVFLKPDLVVIFDRIEKTRADLDATFLLHTLNEPVGYTARGRPRRPGGGVHTLTGCACIEALAGRGRLTFWPLWPARHRLRVIGGKGYETWVEHPAPPDPAGGVNFPPPRPAHEVGQWRIELQAPTDRPSGDRRTYFLTVLHAGLRAAPPARQRFSFDTQVAASQLQLTIHDAESSQSRTSLAFRQQGPVTLRLTHGDRTAHLRAQAPHRVPRARK